MVAAIAIAFVAYCAFSVWLGSRAHKQQQPTSVDFFLANRKVSWLHLGCTLFATWFSTFAFLGAPGFALKKGPSWIAMIAVFAVGSALMWWFVGRYFWLASRKRSYITPADLLADFYGGNALRVGVGIVSLVALVPYCLIQLVGIGKVVDATSGGAIPYEWAVILTGVVTAFYTFVGGMRAIIWTDLVQGFLFTLVMVVGLGAALYASGGLSSGLERAVAQNPEVFLFDPSQAGASLTMMITWSFGLVLLPHLPSMGIWSAHPRSTRRIERVRRCEPSNTRPRKTRGSRCSLNITSICGDESTRQTRNPSR